MQLVGKSKVTRLNAKNEITYPLIRLPKSFSNEIGSTVEMFEIEEDNSRSLLITFPKSFESKEVIQPKLEVIQPQPKVIQLNNEKSVEERLLGLESEINELKSLLLLNECESQDQIENRMGSAGFEPATSAMSRRRHNQLDHEPCSTLFDLFIINLLSVKYVDCFVRSAICKCL